MTNKDLIAQLPKARQGDIRVIIHNRQAAILSVIPHKEIDERIKAFEKRASLEKSDIKNQETHGSIRLWAADLLATPNPNKASLPFVPSAALWMVLRHWKTGDRDARKLAELTAQKTIPFVIVSHHENARDQSTASDNEWTLLVSKELVIAAEHLAEIVPENLRIL